MALHKRTEIKTILKDIRAGNHRQVYLCFGERYLCHEAADHIEQELVEKQGGTAHTIDGSTEDLAKTLARTRSFSLLPGIQVYRVNDTRILLSREVGSNIWEKAVKAHQENKERSAIRHLANLLALGGISTEEAAVFSSISPDQWQKLFGFSYPENDLSWADRLMSEAGPSTTPSASDTTEKFIAALEQGLPPNNILLLTAENVDKRKKLFTQLKKSGEIIDCSVADGSSQKAVREQKDIIREMALKTLAAFEKSIEPKALDLLFERVGFHPVAIVMEMEKLALFVDTRSTITTDDLDLMVARTREDAIFELTEAIGKRDRKSSLITLSNLLHDNIHSLAILASLRNYLRKMLVFRSMQLSSTPAWVEGMNASQFQNHYLPALKETGEWPDLLKAHPYALFMSFSKAADFSTAALKRSLELLLKAEFRLKGAPIPATIVLEELLISVTSLLERR